MMFRKNTTLLSLLSGFLIVSSFLVGCTEDSVNNPEESSRILIGTDPSTLSDRIEYKNEVIGIDTIDTEELLSGSQQSALDDTLILTLVAEVDPPVYNGTSLQATDVSIHGNKVYVSYNVRGDVFLGGVDVFSIEHPDQPELESSVIFTDTDVNGLFMDGNYLYLASAQEPVDIESPALLERIFLQGGLPTDNSEIIDLVSYAGTDVTVSANNIYVTSGADGGAVTIIRKNTFVVQSSYPIEDARGVDVDNDEIAVIAGTPARLVVFEDGINTPILDYSLTGATIPFSKSTIELLGGKAILGVGDGGSQVICLETGNVAGSFDPPVIEGLDPSLTVTNAATVDQKTLFISNGEAGVYVARSDSRFNANSCSVENLQMLGHLRFDDEQSVNHVAYKNGVLFIASGLGGLKICTVSED